MSKRFMSLDDFMSQLTYGPGGGKWQPECEPVEETYEVLDGSRIPLIFTTEDGEQFEVEHIGQEGGGEGGSEYCYAVIKVGDKFYKIEYSYYSHQGYDTDDAELVEVFPKQKTVTVYE